MFLSPDLVVTRPPVHSDGTGRRIDHGSRASWLALGVFMILIGFHAARVVGDLTYVAVLAAGLACGVVGLRRHRPTVMLPWIMMMSTAVLFAIAGVIRQATEATGDLSNERSLLPDLFALPGYMLFVTAVYLLLRSREADREPGAVLDGIMMTAAAALVVYEVLIAPTLGTTDAWLMARLAVAVYPMISLCLIALAARLAFSPGDRTMAFNLLLLGTISLLVGDVVFAFGEIGTFQAPQALLEIPYLLVPALLGSAVLHPSITNVSTRATRTSHQLGRGRLSLVAIALLAPLVVIATHTAESGRTGALVLSGILSVTAILRLVSAMRAQAASEDRLYHQATHDELTGLPGRSLVLETTDAFIARGRGPVSVMFLDIDEFKMVNDSMGHVMGDRLLVLAAERLSGCVREGDLVGRISGDEFIVVTADLDPIGVSALAERIRTVLSEMFVLGENEVFVSVSIGVSIADDVTSTAATLVQEADTAMYRSKDSGKNTITVFDTSMRERIARRVDLERLLRHALDEREVTVAYQPVVIGPSGRVHGFEALARWNIDGVAISPVEFIRIAEESGLIVPLGNYVLDEGCRQLAHWRRTIPGGESLQLSVNLSPRQMRASDIVDVVAEALDRHRLPGEALWLEITESVMMEDSLTTVAVMSGLRSLGVRLAVDDFGTGYSSLSYLKRFPVSRVKIDRAFVSGLGQHQSDSSIVEAIIAMAEALDLEPVAEGVETHEQARRLGELGCSLLQGFLFSRAVPAEEVPSMVALIGPPGGRRAIRPRRCPTTPTRG
ncbi:MAG: EAL domain-containing protein [Ilumatobacter sp.]|nr:MAG: EAL domain-containing protein [Ilumatobacter sp.]